jgi:hypothetical protein
MNETSSLLLRYLIDVAGADPNKKGRPFPKEFVSPLHCCIVYSPKLIPYLIESGADVNELVNGKSLLDIALEKEGYKDIYINYLLKAGAKPGKPAHNINIKVNSNTNNNGNTDVSTTPISTYYIQTIDPEYDMKIITIPKGTLLYNAYTLKSGTTVYDSIKDLLGIMPFSTKITESPSTLNIHGCIDKFHQRFFYSNPGGGPALGTVTTGKFNACGVFETKRDMRFALLMSPAKYHRIGNESFKPPYKQICEKLPITDCECSYVKGSHQCPFAYDYDVCISSDFLSKHKLDGHIAMAENDSYERIMKKFDEHIQTLSQFSEFLNDHTTLFTSGRAVDKRPPLISFSGFPEIVIHMYTTDWYSKQSKSTFNYSIPIDKAQEQLIKLMLQVNSSKSPSDNPLGIYSPLKLIRVSTVKEWYNIETGKRVENPLYNKAIDDLSTGVKLLQRPGVLFYANNLLANNNKDLELAMDPHTGFILRATKGATLTLTMEDGSTSTYLNTCFPIEKISGSLLEVTGYARSSGNNVWPSDSRLLTISSLSGGRRKTRRIASHKGGRTQNRSVLRFNSTRRNNATVPSMIKNKLITPSKPNTISTDPLMGYMLSPDIESLFTDFMDVIAKD